VWYALLVATGQHVYIIALKDPGSKKGEIYDCFMSYQMLRGCGASLD
jgi:hypothetical protein